MDALRRRIRRYTEWLDTQANNHETYAVVLRAVAHRLRRILEDYPEPILYREYAREKDGRMVPVEEGEGPVYTRWVTAWRKTK